MDSLYISVEQDGDYVRDKSDLRIAMTKNWYFLPKEKSTCMTAGWLTGVLKGDFWVPRYDTLVMRPCLYPPLKDQLQEFLLSEAALQAINLGFDKTHSPDKDWMIVVLATLNEKHPIFAKDYKPPETTVLAKKAILSQVMIPNQNGFFQGLEKSKKRGSIFKHLCTADQITRAKRQKLVAHQANVQSQLERLDLGANKKPNVSFKGQVEVVLEDDDTAADQVSDSNNAVH